MDVGLKRPQETVEWDEGRRKEQWASSDLGGGAGGPAEVWGLQRRVRRGQRESRDTVGLFS